MKDTVPLVNGSRQWGISQILFGDMVAQEVESITADVDWGRCKFVCKPRRDT